MGAVLEFLKQYHNKGDQHLDRIVTGDKTWVNFWTQETKEKSKIWKTMDEPAPKKFEEVWSAGKVKATVFCYRKCVIFIDYLPNAIDPETACKYTVTRYHDTLVKLRMVIKAKRPGMLTKGVVFLHHNAHPP